MLRITIAMLALLATSAIDARAGSVEFFRDTNERIMNCGVSVTALNDEGIGAVIKLQVTAVDRKQPITILEAKAIRFSVRDGQRVTTMLNLTTARLSAADQHLDVPRFKAKHESGDFLYVEKYSAGAAALLRALAKPPIAIALQLDGSPASVSYQVTDALSSSDAQELDHCLTNFADAFR